MSNEVYGPFPSVDDVVALVDRMQLKGLTARNITVFTSNGHLAEFKRRTAVKVATDTSDVETNNKDTLMQKVKNIFIHDDEPGLNIHDKLVELGISDKNATVYSKEIQTGKTLIVADDKIRMGHDPLFDTGNDGALSVRRNI